VKKDHIHDLHVPVSMLKDQSTAELNRGLNSALSLYSKRHDQKKTLSIDEHKQISAMLRKVAAHLMNKVESRHHEHEQIQVLPQATLVSESKPPKKATKPALAKPVTQHKPAPAKPVTQHKPAPAKPKPLVEAPAKPLVDGGVVKQFIWHTLGNQQKHATKAPSMAQLLKGGVRLFNGGKIFFDVHA